MSTARKASSLELFFQLTRRHFLVFFKNKVRLFYTLLVPVIIFCVYVLFLRALELSTVQNTLHELGISADATMQTYIDTLVDSWMLSGIAALSTITVALQTNTVAVEDKQSGVNRDFASSPISRNVLIGSYVLFNFVVTLLICAVYLVICFIYLGCMQEFFLTAGDVCAVIGILIYATVSSTLMTVFICSYIKTEGTMASLVAIFSTAVGFLIGAYMPLGMLPVWVQTVCAFIPGTYACALLRYSFMATPIAELSEYVTQVLQLAGGEELISQLTGSFGYELRFFQTEVGPGFQALALAVFSVLFLALNVLSGKKLIGVLGVVGKKGKKKAAANKDAAEQVPQGSEGERQEERAALPQASMQDAPRKEE